MTTLALLGLAYLVSLCVWSERGWIAQRWDTIIRAAKRRAKEDE